MPESVETVMACENQMNGTCVTSHVKRQNRHEKKKSSQRSVTEVPCLCRRDGGLSYLLPGHHVPSNYMNSILLEI